ncbi:MAG: DUF1501 domain-containing protein [Chloroflexota bacterium]
MTSVPGVWGGRTADLIKGLNSNQNISMNISLSGTNTFQAGKTTVDYAIEPSGNGSVGIEGYDNPVGALEVLKKSALDSMLDLEYQNLFEQTFANTTRLAIDNHSQFSAAIAGVSPFSSQFSSNGISKSFEMVAKTIAARQRLGFKRQTFFIMFGGWDHHDEVLNSQMKMLSVVSKALQEFYTVLGELGMQNNVTTFTASDFARTLTSNGQGSDHAWGGNHMVMGGGVNGGKIYGTYPELHEGNALDTGRGVLIPTTSCDEYFAELATWFGVDRSELSTVFPNIGRFYDTASEQLPIGFMAPSNTPVVDPATLPNKTYLPTMLGRAGTDSPLLTSLTAATAGMVALRRRRINNEEEV